MNVLRLLIEDPDSPEVRALLEASDAYAASLYPAESNHMLDLQALRRPGVTLSSLGSAHKPKIARESGATALRLETGIKQPEAIALYRSCGFVEIAPFGDYHPDPLSMFMEKR